MIEFRVVDEFVLLSLAASERSDSLMCGGIGIWKKYFYANDWMYDRFNYPVDGIKITYSISGQQNI